MFDGPRSDFADAKAFVLGLGFIGAVALGIGFTLAGDPASGVGIIVAWMVLVVIVLKKPPFASSGGE